MLESVPNLAQHGIFENGFQVLPIEPHHVANLINMKQIHKDPFDRLLISQAAVEDISLVSADAMFDGYPIKRIW